MIGSALNVVKALATRPGLWPTAWRAGRDHTPAGWWRHRPYLPLPDRAWMKFRLVTAYGGDGSGPIQAEDLITWLEWRRHFPG